MNADISRVAGQVINLGTSRSTDIGTLAQMILRRMKKPASLVKYVGDRPGQVFRIPPVSPKPNVCLTGSRKPNSKKDWTRRSGGIGRTASGGRKCSG